MSSEATSYVRRHIRGITLVERAVLMNIADRCGANGKTPRGRGPSHQTLAKELEVSERTIRVHVDSLQKKKALTAPSRCTFEIPGIEEHDPLTCGHPDCLKIAEDRQRWTNQKATRNRQDPAGKERSSSSLTGRILQTNRQDPAAKTLPLRGETAPDSAQGSAPRAGAEDQPLGPLRTRIFDRKTGALVVKELQEDGSWKEVG